MFLGNLHRLTQQVWFERDDAHSAVTVAAKWQEVYDCVSGQINMVDCCGGAGGTYIDQRNIINQRTMINNQNFGITQNFVQQWIDASNDVTIVFDGCPEEFDADSGDSGDDVLYRDQALCFAARALIDTILEGLQDQIIGLAPDVAALVTSGSFIPYVNIPIWAVGIGLVTIGVTAHDIAGRDEYREFLACCITDTLRGASTNDLTSFQAGLPSPVCDGRPDLGDVVQEEIGDQIENYIRSQLSARENYLAFASVLSVAFDIVKANGGYACPCDDTWMYTWLDGTDDGSEFFTFYDLGQTAPATYDSGLHRVVGHYDPPAAPNASNYIFMSFDTTVTWILDRIRITCTYDNHRSPTTAFIYSDSTEPRFTGHADVFEELPFGTNVTVLDTGETELNETISQQLCLFAYCPQVSAANYFHLTKIEVWGHGVDPFD